MDGVLVELPVVARSNGGAVRLLGGGSGVAGLTAATAAQPRLWLRPDDVLSHPVAGDVAPATAFLLRVTRQRRLQGGAGGAGVARADEWRVDPAAVAVLARLPRRVTFTRMADFQYVFPGVPAAEAVAPDAAAALVAAAEGVAEPTPAIASLVAALDSAPLLLAPASFSRLSVPHDVPWHAGGGKAISTTHPPAAVGGAVVPPLPAVDHPS